MRLHGDEKRIVLSVVEAIGAGCFPFSLAGTRGGRCIESVEISAKFFHTIEGAVTGVGDMLNGDSGGHDACSF